MLSLVQGNGEQENFTLFVTLFLGGGTAAPLFKSCYRETDTDRVSFPEETHSKDYFARKLVPKITSTTKVV